MAELDPRRWKALAVVCAAFFMTVLDVSIVNVALPSIGKALNFSRDEPPVGHHRLRDHLRRLPAARRPRGRPARTAARLPRRRRRLHDRLVLLRPRLVGGRADRRARRAGPRRGDHLAGRALDHHDDVRGGRRAQQGARHLGRDRRLGRRGRRARRRRADQVPRLGVDLLRQRPGRRDRVRCSRRGSCARAAPSARARPDVAGAVTVTAGLALLVYAVSKAPDHGWGSGWTLSRLAIAAVLLVAFLVIESRAKDPLMPFSIFRVRTVAGANVAGLLLGGVVFANFFILTLYVQQVLGYSALKTGITFVATAGSAVLWAGVAQALVTQHRREAGDGGRLRRDDRRACSGTRRSRCTRRSGPTSCPGYLLVGFALPFTFIPVSIAALAGVEQHEAGLASGLINTAQQIGGAIGVAVASSVSISHFNHQLKAGRHRSRRRSRAARSGRSG